MNTKWTKQLSEESETFSVSCYNVLLLFIDEAFDGSHPAALQNAPT